LDLVVHSLASRNILVMLDNHISDADWCCDLTDGNGVWFNRNYTVQQWQDDWIFMARRYINVPQVVAADLRNEVRMSCHGLECRFPNWAGIDRELDWRATATLMGNLLLQINSHLLIVVEGLESATDLTHVGKDPITLMVPNQLAYSSHNYHWDNLLQLGSYESLKNHLDHKWGYIPLNNTAPLILGEFGTCHSDLDCVVNNQTNTNGFWFQSLIRYLNERSYVHWFYWAIDGTQSTGRSREWGSEEGYGILTPTWNSVALPKMMELLQSIQN